MFKIEKDQIIVEPKSQRSTFRKELIETMKALKSGESFVIPSNRVFHFYRELDTWHDRPFKSNKISETEVRIFKL